MKIDVDELSPIQRKIRVELPPETVNKEFYRVYENLSRRVKIKGFRAGKAPRTVLQRLYGDDIKGQVRSQLVEESLIEALKDRGLEVVSRPEIETNHEIEEGKAFSFSAVVEIKPEIELKNYLGVEVERVKFAIEDDQVDEALRRFQDGHARLELVEGRDIVQQGDFVTVDFVGSIGGKPFPGGKGENYQMEVGAGQTLPQFEEAVVGAKRGEERSVRVPYPEDFANRELAGKTVDFTLVVREMKTKVLPPLDDEFAKEYGECDSLDALRAKIRERLEHELKQIQDEELKEQLLNRLIEAHSFTPPPAMVERQTRYLLERHQHRPSGPSGSGANPEPSPEETRKNLQERATRQVKATLLMEKIAGLEKIEVSDKDLQERIDGMARAAGDRAKTLREIYQRADARDDLRSQIAFDRTLSHLLDRAKVKEIDPPAPKVDAQKKKS